MDGLIVKEPYATQLVRGEKEYEFRTRALPIHKTNVNLFVLSGGYVKGCIKFDGYEIDGDSFSWHVSESKEFSPYMKYKHKSGCIVWINNVEILE